MRKSILNGVGEIIDGALGLCIDAKTIGKAPHYRHRKSCMMLSSEPVTDFDGKALIKKIYEKIESNLAADRRPSRENWRLTKNHAKIDEGKANNREKKIEVKLERNIITMDDWFNQVPTASGLVNERSDKRGSIDLVHRCDGQLYEFIELKVTSNNPLYAAMEILQYGVLYMLARQAMNAGEEKELLKAKAIHLKVLAPTNYYERFKKLRWLESDINSGLEKFLRERALPFQMTFKFEAFPPYFSLSPFPKDEAIKQALEDRRSVYS